MAVNPTIDGDLQKDHDVQGMSIIEVCDKFEELGDFVVLVNGGAKNGSFMIQKGDKVVIRTIG